MALYELRIKRDAEKDIRKLPKSDRSRIIKRIYELSRDPRPDHCEKLKGETGYRFRQGNYRIVYLVDDAIKTVRVIRVGHRRDVYR